MSRDIDILLGEILDSIVLIRDHTEGLDLDALAMHVEKQDSVVRRLEIIGEAVPRQPSRGTSCSVAPDISQHDLRARSRDCRSSIFRQRQGRRVQCARSLTDLEPAENPFAPARPDFQTSGDFVAYLSSSHLAYHLGQLVAWRAQLGSAVFADRMRWRPDKHLKLTARVN